MTDRVQPYIGVDFDGTLARYGSGDGVNGVGDPIPLMINRVKNWLAQGYGVRIITARFVIGEPAWNKKQIDMIHEFLAKEGLPPLPVQAHKCFAMLEMYDDRAVQVEANTGQLVGHSTRGL